MTDPTELQARDPQVEKARENLAQQVLAIVRGEEVFIVDQVDALLSAHRASVLRALQQETDAETLQRGLAAASIAFTEGGPMLGDAIDIAIESLKRLDRAVTAAAGPLTAKHQARIAELEGELAVANEGLNNRIDAWVAAEAEVGRLREALGKYGFHLNACNVNIQNGLECDCGLNAALRGDAP